MTLLEEQRWLSMDEIQSIQAQAGGMERQQYFCIGSWQY
jgi:hypothetical protein